MIRLPQALAMAAVCGLCLSTMTTQTHARISGLPQIDLPGFVHLAYGGGYGGGDSGDSEPRGGGGLSRTLKADLRIVAPRAGLSLQQAQKALKAQKVNTKSTTLIRLLIEDQQNDCSQLPRPFIIDCLIDGYRDISKALPRRGDYAPVRTALDKVSRELSQIARAERGPRATPRRPAPPQWPPQEQRLLGREIFGRRKGQSGNQTGPAAFGSFNAEIRSARCPLSPDRRSI